MSSNKNKRRNNIKGYLTIVNLIGYSGVQYALNFNLERDVEGY